MVAGRIPGILPPLTLKESLEVTGIFSVAGLLPPGQALITRRPFYAPHHTVTQAALIGGGSGIPRPGMVSLAHRGVLFLDELPEFRKNVLDGMRQPMEERKVQIARSAGMVTYPSDFILVAAMNPCPCGYYPDRNKCRCTQPQIEKYLGKISGPILDRIDLCVELHPVDILHLQKTKTEKSSEDMKRQIRHARERRRSVLQERIAVSMGTSGLHRWKNIARWERRVRKSWNSCIVRCSSVPEFITGFSKLPEP